MAQQPPSAEKKRTINEPIFKSINVTISDTSSYSYKETLKLSSEHRGIAIHSFLTSQECKDLINATEKVGYDSIADEYPPEYRNSTRVLVINKELARIMWRRLRSQLTSQFVSGLRPFGFGNGGTWTPKELNECFRFSKYNEGGHFSAHRDGNFSRTDDERSIFTLQIYLNSDCIGGETNFYTDVDRRTLLHSVKPSRGLALLFNHDVPHSGERVKDGTKYILRTDLMFCRIHPPYEDDQADLLNPHYREAKEYYNKCVELFYLGDPVGSTACYLKAQRLHTAARPSVPPVLSTGPEASWFPMDLYHFVFLQLCYTDLCSCASVSQAWRALVRDNEFWMKVYRRSWPKVESVEATIRDVDEAQSFTKDWFNVTKYRYAASKNFKVLVLDIGSSNFKFGVTEGRIVKKCTVSGDGKFGCFPSKYGKKRSTNGWGYEDGYYDYFFSDDKSSRTIYKMVDGARLWQDFEAVKQLITEASMCCSNRYRVHSNAVLVALPYNLTPDDRSELSALVPGYGAYMCVAHPAILSLHASGITTGVVVDCGGEAAYVVAVVSGIVQHKSTRRILDYSKHPEKLVHAVESVIKEVFTTDPNLGYWNIKLTGGGSIPLASDFTSQVHKLFSGARVIIPPSPIFDIVEGGSVFSSLSNARDTFTTIDSNEGRSVSVAVFDGQKKFEYRPQWIEI